MIPHHWIGMQLFACSERLSGTWTAWKSAAEFRAGQTGCSSGLRFGMSAIPSLLSGKSRTPFLWPSGWTFGGFWKLLRGSTLGRQLFRAALFWLAAPRFPHFNYSSYCLGWSILPFDNFEFDFSVSLIIFAIFFMIIFLSFIKIKIIKK